MISGLLISDYLLSQRRYADLQPTDFETTTKSSWDLTHAPMVVENISQSLKQPTAKKF
jgi:hypothetical protein